LNERAMLAGELARFDERIEKLTALRASTSQRLAALDQTLARLDARVEPAAGRVVRAQNRFGARGAFTAFIVVQLQQASPEALDTVEIAQRCAAHFGLTFDTKRDFLVFQKRDVKLVLRTLREANRVQSTRQPGRYGANLWRWGGRQADLQALLTVQQLSRTQSPEPAHGVDDDANPHADDAHASRAGDR